MVHVSFKAPGRHVVVLRFTPLRKHYSAFKGKKLKPSLHRDLTCSKALGDSAATRYSTQTRLGGFFLGVTSFLGVTAPATCPSQPTYTVSSRTWGTDSSVPRSCLSGGLVGPLACCCYCCEGRSLPVQAQQFPDIHKGCCMCCHDKETASKSHWLFCFCARNERMLLQEDCDAVCGELKGVQAEVLPS